MWWRLIAATFMALASVNAVAEETIKVGLILPMTGPFTTTGKQVEAGARFYMQQNGASVDGKKIELILRDDAGIADNSRRIAQELLVGDKVNILAGFGLTPIALAVAPLATETKTPMVVMAAATAIVTERSPYIVRSSFPQAAPVVIIADWEAKHGLKKVATVVSDFAPGHDSETYFKQTFTRAGGEVPLALRVPLLNPDFAPFLQRVRDTSPDGVFVFIPAGQAATMMRQFVERGLDKSSIRLFGAGDITDDDLLNNMGDVARLVPGRERHRLREGIVRVDERYPGMWVPRPKRLDRPAQVMVSRADPLEKILVAELEDLGLGAPHDQHELAVLLADDGRRCRQS